MTQTLRERATDQLGVVHEVVVCGWSLLTTRCSMRGQWEDRDFVANVDAMTWNGFDPRPDITCMVCLVREARG